MPLGQKERANVLRYCARDVADHDWFEAQFDFVEDASLKSRLASEFEAARYIYKLGEALAVNGNQLHAHIKFQIVQYASIYEAVIVYLIWSKFEDHPAVEAVQYHKAFKVTGEFPAGFSLTNIDNEPVRLCVERKQRTSTFSIKFNDKVDTAVKIGFIDNDIAEDIKAFYTLRNAIHLETAVKQETEYELEQSQLAYRRMKPFLEGVRSFLDKMDAEESREASALPNDALEQDS